MNFIKNLIIVVARSLFVAFIGIFMMFMVIYIDSDETIGSIIKQDIFKFNSKESIDAAQKLQTKLPLKLSTFICEDRIIESSLIKTNNSTVVLKNVCTSHEYKLILPVSLRNSSFDSIDKDLFEIRLDMMKESLKDKYIEIICQNKDTLLQIKRGANLLIIESYKSNHKLTQPGVKDIITHSKKVMSETYIDYNDIQNYWKRHEPVINSWRDYVPKTRQPQAS